MRARVAHVGVRANDILLTMSRKTKSWTQKWQEAVAKPGLPKVLDCEEMGTRFVVPGPAEVEEIVRHVPRGKVLTMAEMADQLAKKHRVKSACPMTTGVFAWILAHAAEEAKDASIPWWRIVKTGGELNPKYPGAPDLQKGLLEAEGHRVAPKGRKLIVVA